MHRDIFVDRASETLVRVPRAVVLPPQHPRLETYYSPDLWKYFFYLLGAVLIFSAEPRPSLLVMVYISEPLPYHSVIQQ